MTDGMLSAKRARQIIRQCDLKGIISLKHVKALPVTGSIFSHLVDWKDPRKVAVIENIGVIA